MGGSYSSDPYGGGGSYSKDPYGESGGKTVAAPKKSGGGGILGAIEHAAHATAQSLDRSAHTLAGIPGGTLDLVNKGVVQPWKDVITTGHVSHKTNANIDKTINQQSEAVKQILSRPGHDPIATLMLVSPLLHGAGTVAGRGAAAAEAARAGEGVSGVAKAVAKVPEVKPRILRSGTGETSLIPSRNAGVRGIQRAYDKTLNRAIEKNPGGRVAAHGQKRIGGAKDEEARIQQRERAVPAVMLDKAAGKLSKTPVARRAEQAALELTSHQVTPAEAAKYHFEQAKKGVNPEQNQAVAKLYQRVGKRDLVHLDETRPAGEKVFINPAREALAKTDAALARVQTRGDRILVEKGVRTEGQLAERRNAPARLRAGGGSYEKRTPGKLGVPSQTILRATAERDRLASLHEKALQQDEKWHAQPARDLRAPMTSEQARARLAALDKEHEALVKKISPEVNPYAIGGKGNEDLTASGSATRTKNTVRGRIAQGKGDKGATREGRVGAGSKKVSTVGQEVRDLAEGKLAALAEKHAGTPWADNLQSLLNERDQLRDTLTKRGEAGIFGEKPPTLPRRGAQPELPALQSPFRNRIVQTGHALELAQEKVNRLSSSAEKRVKPTGIVGGETARPGRGFLSDRISEKKMSKAEASASRPPVVGVTRSPITSKTYTGRAQELGLRPKHVAASASRHFREIIKFVNTDARRRAAYDGGTDVKRSAHDVIVRNPDVTVDTLAREIQAKEGLNPRAAKIEAGKRMAIGPAMQQALGRERSTVDTVDELGSQEGLRAAHQMLLQHAIPGLADKFARDKEDAIGTPAPAGSRWVHVKALGELTNVPSERPLLPGRIADNINSSVTAMTVYFKIGHLGTRVLTNAATNFIQGSANPLQVKRSYELWNKIGERDQGRALGAAGQHGFSSLPHEGDTVIARVAGRGAQWWAKHADAMFRFNSLAYELRKVGYKTPEEFTKALDGLESGGQGLPAHEWSKLSAAARRADREAISYDRLSPFERRYITRGLWFYPWIKGSTLFTVRTILEHPYKAAALGTAGTRGRQVQEGTLGPVPSYEQGLIALGGGPHPLTTDLSTFSPFATGGDVTGAIARPGGLAGFFNPAAAALGQFAYGLNQYGGASKSPYLDALLALGSPTPEQQLAESYHAQGSDQSKRMFPKSPGGTLERFLIGPATPRRVNRAALNSAAAREKSGRR